MPNIGSHAFGYVPRQRIACNPAEAESSRIQKAAPLGSGAFSPANVSRPPRCFLR